MTAVRRGRRKEKKNPMTIGGTGWVVLVTC